MTRVRRAGRQTFRSLRHPAFRRYVTGQLVSASGTWMQQVAMVWLVLRLTGNGVAVGAVGALQFLPVLVLGAWAGSVADRVDKRRLLVVTSCVAAATALFLGVLTLLDAITVWAVYGTAIALGVANALDNPARRSFVTELVPAGDEANAVSLNSTVFTTARIVGPAAAGLMIATIGTGWCFVANSLSYLAMVAALAGLRRSELRPSTPVVARRGLVREGLRYAWANPPVRRALWLTAVVGTLSFNFQVTLSLLVEDEFGGEAGSFGVLYALMSVGALVGSLVVAHRRAVSQRFVAAAAFAFGGLMLGAAAAPTLGLEAVALVPMGAASIAFLAGAGALAQTASEPAYRGRVAALFAVAFLGSTPIGGPIIGWISEQWGPRAGMLLGAAAALAAGAVALRAIARERLAASEAASDLTLTPDLAPAPATP